MNKEWIRLISLVASLSLSMSLFACGENENSLEDTERVTDSVAVTDTERSDESNGPTDGTDVTEKESDKVTGLENTEETEKKTDSEKVTEESKETDKNDDSEQVTESETEEITEKDEEETVVKKLYGYDFKDNTWKELFDMAGGAVREIAIDPAGSGEAVLEVTHSASQSASWIRNKNAFENTKTGKFIISVDLYIPSEAFADASGYVQIMLNGDPNHHGDLVSDSKENLTPFETKDFPRDKWFKLQYIFDMDNLKYDLSIVEDGQIRSTVFLGRSAKSLKETGSINMRVFVGGADQTVYVDHLGVVTTESGEVDQDTEVVSGVSFLRIDGINAAGNKLSIYGDFAGDAKISQLTDISWERSSTYGGTYNAINNAGGLDYTPADGGYYLRVKAKYGNKTLTSYPVYVREEANNGFVNGYLSHSGSTLTAAVVYNNEFDAYGAQVKVVVYNGNTAVNTYTKDFTAKQGSDVVIFTFDNVDMTGKRAEMTVVSGGNTISEKVTVDGDLPLAKVQKASEGTSVLVDKQRIAYFKQNRYMQFRPTVENDHWIGTEHNPVDMGFAYQEKPVAGLINTDVQFIAAPGVFKIVFIGEKAGLKATQQNELIGFYNSDTEEFSFIYNASMTADTATWHASSTWAPQSRIEAFDYNIERMSILDRVFNKNHNGDLYDYVIYENGDELTRIPKLPVPRTMLKGKYFYGFFLSPGESFYFPDAKDRGWNATLLSAVGDTYIEICWSWYDIHNCAENSVPRVGNAETFTVSQSWLYTTTSAEFNREIINDAVEVDWKDLPNYQLPLFSTNNTFETQFGGTDWQYAWWKSSYDCTMDAEVGHNEKGSVKISKTASGEASWYTEGVWGFPYSFDDVRGKTYRVSGYIKTENVVGEAYIANIQYQHATPNDNTVTMSEKISGTTDWTYITFTFTAQMREKADGSMQNCIDHFFLTLNGTGTVWFDDVTITEVK